MKNTPIVKDHNSAWRQLEDHSIFRIFHFACQNLKVAVKLANFLCWQSIEGRPIIKIVANLQNLFSHWIQNNDWSRIFVMTILLDVFSRHNGIAQSLVHVWMFFFYFLSHLIAVDKKIFATRSRMIDAMKNLQTRSIVEIGVVIVRPKIN